MLVLSRCRVRGAYAQVAMAQLRHFSASAGWCASSKRVPLAYELHEPPKGITSSPGENGSPIIFLHGFLGSKRENRQISEMLSHDLSRPVYTLDLRNHGDSGHHPEHDYMELALDVQEFMETHDIEESAVIGHSMGAKTALTLALHSPEQVSAVVAIDNSPVELRLESDFSKYLVGMIKVRDAGVRTHSQAEQILKEYSPDPTIRLWLLSNLVKDPDSRQLKMRVPLETLQRARGPLGSFPFAVGEMQYHGPALFVRGLRSRYVPDSVFPQIKSLFPESEVVSIDCGHWVVQEEPEQLRQAIVEFLK